MKELKIEMNVSIQAIEEILVTAMEGGSNYWYFMDGEDKLVKWFDEKINKGELKRDDSIHYKWMDAMFQGCPHKVRILDGEEAEWGDAEDYDEIEPLGYLTMDTISKGLSIASKEYERFFKMHVPDYNDGDIESADVLFQLMVMGDVVYG